jgi:FkbM family methyltransferase
MSLNQLYDMQTVEIMRRALTRGSNCIDVGCHAGDFLTQMLEICPEGRHLAFEPIPDLFAQLERKFANEPRVTLHRSALSDGKGIVSFQHVVSNPGYSGLKQRRYDRDNETITEITVQTERLDDVVPATGAISFIKIDVEGAELQVLSGAKNTIARCKPIIVFEHGLGAADHYGTTPEAVFDLLTAECGMSCSTMGRWLAGESSLDKAEFAKEFYSGANFYFLAV